MALTRLRPNGELAFKPGSLNSSALDPSQLHSAILVSAGRQRAGFFAIIHDRYLANERILPVKQHWPLHHQFLTVL